VGILPEPLNPEYVVDPIRYRGPLSFPFLPTSFSLSYFLTIIPIREDHYD